MLLIWFYPLSSRIVTAKHFFIRIPTNLSELESWNHSFCLRNGASHRRSLPCLRTWSVSEFLEICNSAFLNSVSLLIHASSTQNSGNPCVKGKAWVGWAGKTTQVTSLTPSFRSMQTVWFTVFNIVILDSSPPPSLYVLDQSGEPWTIWAGLLLLCKCSAAEWFGVFFSVQKKKKGDGFVSYLIKQ